MMKSNQIKYEIKNILSKQFPQEMTPRDIVNKIKSSHKDIITSEIKSIILTLIDNDQIQLTKNLGLKLYRWY